MIQCDVTAGEVEIQLYEKMMKVCMEIKAKDLPVTLSIVLELKDATALGQRLIETVGAIRRNI